MDHPSRQAEQVREFILNNVERHPSDIARVTAGQFGISRESVVRQLRGLISRKLLTASGATKGKRYALAWINAKVFSYEITKELKEDNIWRTDMRPIFDGLKKNVLELCQYGFTEIFNNAIEHSESPRVITAVRMNPLYVDMRISDFGVGIFGKIQRALNLSDPRHALLELSKGKLTTDPSRHTGEGIFFTSRMFDEFSVLSDDLFYRVTSGADGWLTQTETREAIEGSFLTMKVRLDSSRTLQEVFDRYSAGDSEFDFSRTHVPVDLARYGDEQLVSRSQARRVLARFERFREVLLDFNGVATIGHSFADEIFRVFKRERPEVKVTAIRTTPQVSETIRKVTSEDGSQLSFSQL
ncbi:MAG: STAS-like domain-containing protein [Candidatus Binatia bacterium]